MKDKLKGLNKKQRYNYIVNTLYENLNSQEVRFLTELLEVLTFFQTNEKKELHFMMKEREKELAISSEGSFFQDETIYLNKNFLQLVLIQGSKIILDVFLEKKNIEEEFSYLDELKKQGFFKNPPQKP